MPDIIETSLTIDVDSSQLKASQLLANHTNLSQAKVKDAMQKGAVWLLRGNGKKRLRRASKPLQAGDKLELNYNAQLLTQAVPEPQLIHDAKDYSVWFKPYGLYCQGSRWGDFASINRWVEINLPKVLNTTERPVFIVHRLDRATTGLILLCHSKTAARLFSEMFRDGKMDKRYQAIVEGDFSVHPQDHEVNQAVDGKAACSFFSYVDDKDGCSLVNVKLITGRKHQIRHHLSSLGYPIVGDRLYGNGTDENEGRDLQLQSVSLQFTCPMTGQEQQYSVAENQRLQLDSR
ncbi:pseudouridine synthase family protein [Granulosicoccus antarcticus]|uniref:Ribosomal large subunit pseudouridine synthase C n=1 Tax=Granulosicoccus antarcticus IMCC3135 TaxID=1192854 RepID=A0A2Z2NXS4_9GAMM|nr:RluA family pseudouridine synthase [Granulosicoccus antarcticus]ASJ73620.1 Ribosomal large subunit pseudouridine synthase C [Granulosicoccus antarcticus IMCC3135]